MKHILTFLALVLLTTMSLAQVGIGTTTPHPSSILDVNVDNLWSSTNDMTFNGYGWTFSFNGSSVVPGNGFPRASGFSVRCVSQ